MAGILPPPPARDEDLTSISWQEWFRQVRSFLVGGGGLIGWNSVSKDGATLVDIPDRKHNDLQSIQGGAGGDHYHLTQAQALMVPPNSLEVLDTSASVSLPTTPTVFKPPTTVSSNGITYDSSTGIVTFTKAGSYTFLLLLNAQASASNKNVFFYAEVDTGSGFSIRRYSARQHELLNASTQQLTFASANQWDVGHRFRLSVWCDSSSVTLKSVDVPGTTAGTVTLPATRLLVVG